MLRKSFRYFASRNVSFKSARRKATRCGLYDKVDKVVEARTVCRMDNSELVQSLLKRTWNLLTRKYGLFTKNTKSYALISRPVVNNSSHHRTEILRGKLSHLGQIVRMKTVEFIVNSGASHHMLSENELALGEKDTLTRSEEPTMITTASGEAELTEEATKYVKYLDVFVTMVLLEDSPAVLCLGLSCEEMSYAYQCEIGRVSIFDYTWKSGKVQV